MTAKITFEMVAIPVLKVRHRHYVERFPWTHVEVLVDEKLQQRARANHGQTVQRLAQRGGLAPSEIMALLEDRPYHQMTEAEINAAWHRHFKEAR
jgi:hypothetical protein